MGNFLLNQRITILAEYPPENYINVTDEES